MVTREDVENIALLSKLFVPEEDMPHMKKRKTSTKEFTNF